MLSGTTSLIFYSVCGLVVAWMVRDIAGPLAQVHVARLVDARPIAAGECAGEHFARAAGGDRASADLALYLNAAGATDLAQFARGVEVRIEAMAHHVHVLRLRLV